MMIQLNEFIQPIKYSLGNDIYYTEDNINILEFVVNCLQ